MTIRRIRAELLAATVLAGVLALTAGSAQAAPGTLDPSFGSGGKVTTDIGGFTEYGYGLVVQPDGKIVLAGLTYTASGDEDIAVTRYNPGGSLDGSFGSAGKVVTAIGSDYDEAYGIALQPDGKIVVAGDSFGTNYNFALVRYNADGSLDSSFDSDGKVTTIVVLGDDSANAVTLQPDGKIVAAGYAGGDFAVVRYDVNGSPDASFGAGGVALTPIGAGSDNATAVAVQPDGKIVAAGYSSNGTNQDVAVVRYNANGSLDTSFDSDGKVTTAIGSGNDLGLAVALQPDGKIVVAGLTYSGLNQDFALVRYNAGGSLDTSFDSDGKVTTAFGSGNDEAQALVLQPDGKIVAGGSTYIDSIYQFALARYNQDGTLDTGFDSDGKVATAFGPGAFGYATALQPDGKIVVAGYSSNGTNDDFALVRYLGSTLTVAKAGSGTGTVTSSPAGISCGSTCSAPFAAVPVTLTATASGGSSFQGWSGDCSGTGTCNLSMSTDHSATATFESDKALTVTKAGSGAGKVTSSPGGIDCGATCSHAYTHGTSVTLTATASAGSSFAGWSGDCSGTATCQLAMSAPHAATAVFESNKTLTVARAGAGSGTVTSAPAGISCGSTCSHAFTHGTPVTLAAAASSKSKFKGWSGDCSGTGSCKLAMSANRSATATFKPLCVVPKVKGKKLRTAKRAIKRAHCSVGRIKRVYSAKVRKRRVVAQKPRAGAKHSAGWKVKLKVSKGKRR